MTRFLHLCQVWHLGTLHNLIPDVKRVGEASRGAWARDNFLFWQQCTLYIHSLFLRNLFCGFFLFPFAVLVMCLFHIRFMKCTKLIPVRSSIKEGGLFASYSSVLDRLTSLPSIANPAAVIPLKINTKITEISNFKGLNSTEVYFGVCIYWRMC